MKRQKTLPTRQSASLTLSGFILTVLVLLVYWFSSTDDDRALGPATSEPTNEVARESARQQPESPSARPADRGASRSQFSDVTLRDLDGKVVFRGTVDLQPTLDRIAAGERLEFRNDGSTFENREGRLPRKSRGYYTEFVHPTPSLSGPGPQRIVIGKDGEAYYTPDHYRTFRRIR